MADLRSAGELPETARSTLQRDLVTGAWEDKPPARGNGSHIRLKPLHGETPALSGMASFAGEGPVGKFCRNCDHFGEVAVQRTVDAIEMNPTGCALYAQRMGHAAPTRRRDIRLCADCKHFEPADEVTRRFIVDQAGGVHRIEKFPKDLRDWRPEPYDSSVCLPDAVLCTKSS